MANTGTLKERVTAFRCMELPGQPQSMHMGTAYLVGELWQEVILLRAQIARTEDVLNRALAQCENAAKLGATGPGFYEDLADTIRAILARPES